MSRVTHCSLHSTYNGECVFCIAWTLFTSEGGED